MLEVGLGGRLDAVNIVDADVAVVTSVDHRSHRLPRSDARRHRPREGRHLSRRTPRRLRRSRPARDARRARAGARRAACVDRARLRLRPERAANGTIGARAAARHGLPFPALRGADPARERRDVDCSRSISCAIALPVSAGAVRDGLVSVELAGRFQVLPGTPDGRARRRAQSARGARARRRPRRDGIPSAHDRGVRHARRQGHRRRRRRDDATRRSLASSPRCRGRAAPMPPRCAARSSARASRLRACAPSTMSRRPIARRGTKRTKLIESSFSDRS